MFSGFSVQVRMPEGNLVDSHYEVHYNETLSYLITEVIRSAALVGGSIEKVTVA